MSTGSSRPVPAWLGRLLDDAAAVATGDSPIGAALGSYRRHLSGPFAPVLGALAVGEAQLPDLARLLAEADASPPDTGPLDLAVVVSGGAGSLEPAVRWAAQVPGARLATVEITLRGSDTGELPHNARRVVTAVDQLLAAGELTDDTAVVVAVPRLQGPQAGHGWLAALDEIAAMDHRLGFRVGGRGGPTDGPGNRPGKDPAEDAAEVPTAEELAVSIGAALDRELAFACPAGPHPALRQDDGPGRQRHGFLNVLLATRASLDGAATDEVAGVLRLTDPDAVHELLAAAGETGLASARRWFTSVGSSSVEDAVADLVGLGLLPDAGRP